MLRGFALKLTPLCWTCCAGERQFNNKYEHLLHQVLVPLNINNLIFASITHKNKKILEGNIFAEIDALLVDGIVRQQRETIEVEWGPASANPAALQPTQCNAQCTMH